MSDPQSNYMLLKIPVANADLVFDALCAMYGKTPDEENDKEACARQALIGVVENAVTEMKNRKALEAVASEDTDLGIN